MKKKMMSCIGPCVDVVNYCRKVDGNTENLYNSHQQICTVHINIDKCNCERIPIQYTEKYKKCISLHHSNFSIYLNAIIKMPDTTQSYRIVILLNLYELLNRAQIFVKSKSKFVHYVIFQFQNWHFQWKNRKRNNINKISLPNRHIQTRQRKGTSFKQKNESRFKYLFIHGRGNKFISRQKSI